LELMGCFKNKSRSSKDDEKGDGDKRGTSYKEWTKLSCR